MINRSSSSMVSNPIICCFVTHWGSTTHGMRRPQHKKTVRTYRPLERGLFHSYAIFWTHSRTKHIRSGDNQPGMDFFPHLRTFEIGIHAREWRGHALFQSPVSDELAWYA